MAKLSRADRLRKVQDLFVKGTEVLMDDGLVFWVQALSALDNQQVHQDARTAMLSARMRWLASDEEQEQMALFLKTSSIEGLARTLAMSESGEVKEKMTLELFSEEALKDKIELIQNYDPEAATPEEAATFAELSDWFYGELEKRVTAAIAERESELLALSRPELERENRNRVMNMEGQKAYMVRHIESQILHSLRMCDAVVSWDDSGEASYDHSACDHNQRVLETIQEVRDLPDALQALVKEALEFLAVGVDVAGKSEGPKGS